MTKNLLTLAPDLTSERPRRKVLPILSLFIAVPLLAPLVIDAVAFCYGQWCDMLGIPSSVRTPTLDAIGEELAGVREEVRYHVTSHFQRVPWNPRVVLAVSVVVMLLAMTMLRR
jgi:hypothetical protein